MLCGRRMLPVVLSLVATGAVSCSLRDPDPGQAGQNNLPLVWKDATGTVVTLSASLLYRDDADHLWPLDPETARPVGESTGAGLWLENEGCTGTAFTAQWAPRQVIRLWGETAYRVRADTVATVDVVTRSARNSAGDCLPTGAVTQRLLPVAALSGPLPEPTFSFAPPLRLEPP